MNSSSGIYEKYYEIYRTGNYLTYTHSLEEEQALADQLYEEISVVSRYDDYIRTVQENSSRLSGISIFQSGGSEESFTSRNIRKSAEDHSAMTGENIRWFPAKGITMALENPVSDLLLLLSVFLFMGQLIAEEKEKELFAVTKSFQSGCGRGYGGPHCCAFPPLYHPHVSALWHRSAVRHISRGSRRPDCSAPVSGLLYGKQCAGFHKYFSSGINSRKSYYSFLLRTAAVRLRHFRLSQLLTPAGRNRLSYSKLDFLHTDSLLFRMESVKISFFFRAAPDGSDMGELFKSEYSGISGQPLCLLSDCAGTLSRSRSVAYLRTVRPWKTSDPAPEDFLLSYPLPPSQQPAVP